MWRHILPITIFLLAIAGDPAFGQLQMQWSWQLPERKPAWQFTQRMPQDRAYVPVAGGDLVFVGCEHNGALLAWDAATGEEKWRFYTNAPIRVAPVADNERVYVASDDGYLYCLNHQGKLQWKFRGGREDRWVIGHDRLISAWPASARPVLADGKLVYQAGHWPVDGVYVHALDPASGKRLWTTGDLQFRPYGQLRTGDGELYVYGFHGSGTFDLATGRPTGNKPPKPGPPRELPNTPGVKGSVAAKVQSGERVFVATHEGMVYGFEGARREPRRHVSPSRDDKARLGDKTADQVFAHTEIRDGYCMVVEPVDERIVDRLLKLSSLHVVVVDGNTAKVNTLRRSLDERGLFNDHRLSVIATNPKHFTAPRYFANIVVAPRRKTTLPPRIAMARRPFGGAFASAGTRPGEVEVTYRKGPPTDSDNWAQEFQNAANTLASRDKLVKAPLGLLWYGGEAAHARFYFDGNVDHQSGHGLNPQPVSAHVVDGRMILQGPGLLAAFDIYTGRLLWETALPKVYTFGGGGGGLGIHSKKHPRPWEHEAALEAEVPVTHRCRASGFNMASTSGSIYVAADQQILRVRPQDGKVLSRWPVPQAFGNDETLCWGGIRESDGVIVATLFRPQEIIDAQAGHDGNGGDWAGDRMPMRYLAALDSQTGKLLWSREASWGYINRSGVCAGNGKLFFVDLVTSKVMDKLADAGRNFSDKPPRVHAIDLKSGKDLWQYDLDVYVQNIAYAAHRDLLLVPCRNLREWRDGKWVNLAIDKRRGKTDKNFPGRMRALHAGDGKVAWEVEDSAYHTPIIVLDDLMIDRYGNSFNLADGQRNRRESPLTGRAQEWSFRKGGCNHLIACDNLVTWRCGFYDLAGGSGAMKLLGMDAGCTPTLLPAGGVLNIPNFGTHHKRNRMTAMALVHRPGNELWTKFAEKPPAEPVAIVRGGYNFGALGDRIDAEGAVWLSVTSRKRENAKWTPSEATWFQSYSDNAQSFATASGIQGATKISLPVTFGGKPPSNKTSRSYQVRLHFAEPTATAPGERVFSIELEGQSLLKNFDIHREAGGRNRPLVKQFDVEVTDMLDISLTAIKGEPLLCGVELIAK